MTTRGLSHDPAMRAVIGKRALDRTAASSGTVSRFEREIFTRDENIDALATLNSGWISKAVSLVGQECDTGHRQLRVTSARNPGGLSIQ